MKEQTAMQSHLQWLNENQLDFNIPLEVIEDAEDRLEMEKQQIIDAYYGYELYIDREFRFQQGGQAKILTFDQWYETYGSKGSDETLKENHIVDTNKMVEDTFKVWECCGMENCICKGSETKQ